MNKDELQTKKRENFIVACKEVSKMAYYDQCSRALLAKLPESIKESACKHQQNKHNNLLHQMSSNKEEIFNIELNTHMWLEALQYCDSCITVTQYLSANVLKNIVEIMLNVQDDNEYSIHSLLNKCHEILLKNFTIHPSSISKNLRKCYWSFLTSPMDLREKTFTSRTQFGYEKGIVIYCFNRLEYEISNESKDGPLVDKYENTPEEMRRTIKGMHWQKEKFEIYEVLQRNDRIERLMAVLESIIELLQLDLAIWRSRFIKNLGNHIMMTHKPLMASILWSDFVLYTGVVNHNCKQIMKIFIHMVHLQYPEKYIKVMQSWLNTMIQTFYICETDSNYDYPNIGKYCNTFANEFCKIVTEMPHESIIRIFGCIKPDFMKMLIGIQQIKTILSAKEDCIVKILIDFIRKDGWRNFPELHNEITHSKSFLLAGLHQHIEDRCADHPKLNLESIHQNTPITLNYIVPILYITLEAFLTAYNIQSVKEKLNSLNEKLLRAESTDIHNFSTEDSYCVSAQFIKKYVYIFKMLKELIFTLKEKKSDMPKVMMIFINIDLLGSC